MKQLIKKILKEEIESNIEIDEFPYGDFILYMGKNAESNDFLTFRKSDDNDLWFHTKDYPGSHVVLSLGGKYPTEDVIYFAASIAKKHSKGKNKDNVKIVYSYISDVFKTKDMKVGQVDVNPSKLNIVTM
jgi:predicted ribosome quality control (RQC) complex YloA/Tae2 family protein